MSDNEYVVKARLWRDVCRSKAGRVAPSSLCSAALLTAEPIMYECQGWGIYGQEEEGGSGKVLTHIGCDCEFPNWTWATFIWDQDKDTPLKFKCTECEAVLSEDGFKEFVKVYKFINNIQS